MGQAKALLPWAGVTLVEYSFAQLREAGASTVVVVLGPDAAAVRATLPPSAPSLVAVVNPHHEAGGRSSSIRAGAAVLPLAAHPIVIQSVDQPCPSTVIQHLYEMVEESPPGGKVAIALPTYEGRAGHPICLSGTLRAELLQVSEEEQGMREIVRRHARRLTRVPVSSSAVLLNLNDPVAYAAAYSALGRE